jgi:HEAT repeat protein
MPLVKPAEVTPQTRRPPARKTLLKRLAEGAADERRAAAAALAADASALPTLAARIEVETDAAVRDALFAAIGRIGGAGAADLVAPFLRRDDAALRSLVVELLKRLGPDAEATLDRLLDDPEADVRLLAIEVTRAWAPEQAVPRLQRLIAAEANINVCGAAVDVATEVGSAALLEPLQNLRHRFADQDFLSFAIDIACARIHTIHPDASPC